MKIKHLLFILTLFVFGLTQTLSAQNHVVKKGDTVYAIANKYGISVQDIYNQNPTATQGVREGESLRISASSTSVSQFRYYTVKAKETLYSISRANNITVQELLDANPTMTTANLQEGKTIKIPAKPIEHKVEKKETLYSIARSYGVSEEAIVKSNPELKKGLKKDMKILIPLASTPKKEEKLAAPAPKAEGFPKTDVKTLRVGVFLPFANETDAHQARFVEYYKGFLLAVHEMKSKGYSMDIYAFDIAGTAKMQALLESNDIKDLHLIVGGVTDNDIQTLAAYAKRNNIKHVIPFPLKDQSKLGENCFVVSRSNQELEDKVIAYYLEKVGSQKTIFIKDNSSNNKAGFTSKLETQLKNQGKQVVTLAYGLSLENDLGENASSKNIIIPMSSSQTALSKIAAVMKTAKEKYPEQTMTLFGYPDWQAYAQLQNELRSLDATIYSSFFLDDSSYWTKVFLERYEKWYATPMLKTFPCYGVLGYDTGLYFLTALSRYGFDFEEKAHNVDVTTLQTALKFVQAQTGKCYINDGLYIVQYSENDIKKEKYNR